jgi:hypothetical protein
VIIEDNMTRDTPKKKENRCGPLFVKLDEDSLRNVREVECAVLRVICSDRIIAMNILLKNEKPGEHLDTIPQISTNIKWVKLDSIVTPGSRVLFTDRKHILPFRVEVPSMDAAFSENGLLVESIFREIN